MVILRPHQEEGVKNGLPILQQHKILYIAGQPRIGKTLTSLVIADKFGAKNVIVVTKKKAISSIEKDIALLAPSYTSTVINYESIHKVEDIKSFDLLICDESHNMAAFPKPSKRHKDMKSRFYDIPVIFLSGTPNPESLSQLYHQFNISRFSPWARYKTFYRWAKDYVIIKQKMINSTLINDYSLGRESLIKNDTRPLTITISQVDAGFEAFVDEVVHDIDMTDQQRLYYDEMDKHFVVEPLNVIATNAADRINKLAQISSGSVINDDGDTITFEGNKKIEYIKEHFAGQKIAIFYKYKAQKDLIQKHFLNITESPEEFNESESLIFIGQFRSISEGVNLKTANCIVMFDIDFSSTTYWQSRSRLQHIDRTEPATIHWLFSKGGIEHYVYKAVCQKKHFTSKYFQACQKVESPLKKVFS